MPRRLLERCQPDSIREFRAAARIRYHDGLTLAMQGHRTAAIYLWGYAAEMILKAAYFSFTGVKELAPLTVPGHIIPAINIGRSLGIPWPRAGQGHNVDAWAQLLIATHARSTQTAYSQPFEKQLARCGQRIYQLWREVLRYHKNVAYDYEVRQMCEAVEWLVIHAAVL